MNGSMIWWNVTSGGSIFYPNQKPRQRNHHQDQDFVKQEKLGTNHKEGKERKPASHRCVVAFVRSTCNEILIGFKLHKTNKLTIFLDMATLQPYVCNVKGKVRWYHFNLMLMDSIR